ncbi:MAG: hypothetical protein EZS28_000615 [Streblomastix strix]|uniref:Uncharacterized protein n=1 Tax=Streblomastix strix TaxID=222440 RepID=A0A5J4X9T2_9EUKA|nr:MAG: hypothetical protein EZS28_000615 [Streblomastix strix]
MQRNHDQQQMDALLLLKANVADIVFNNTKTEDVALLLLKAVKSEQIDSYSKTEDDSLLLLKADMSDTYSKYEDDALILQKANVADITGSFSKTEDGVILLLKANVADLTNYVDLTTAQSISVQKQFGTISDQTISKLSKNDASIFLDGGGIMLVSSLVTQLQLQEVRDIETGKSKGYLFQIYGELNDQMAIQDNVAKLVIGYNLYIVDKEVTDYQWDGTDLKVLETELTDMNIVITTHGAATGGDNAKIGLSIDRNTLTSAKNTIFVTTRFDQSITRMNTFTSAIISNDIQYSQYDS